MKRSFIFISVFFLLIITMNVARSSEEAEEGSSASAGTVEAGEDIAGEETGEEEEAEDMSQEEWEEKEKAAAIKAIFDKRCVKCHSIRKPLSKNKTSKDWEAAVERMQRKDPAWILPVEVEKIINYLAGIRGIREGKTIGKEVGAAPPGSPQ